jgi:phosphate transport system substrate-binding protein
MLVIVLVGAALCLLVYYSPAFFIKEEKPVPLVHLKTGGTSVAHIIMENRWKTAYRRDKSVEVDYDSTGSTEGLSNMIDKKYAISFTHAPMNDEQKKKAAEKGGAVLHVPVVICAVVPVYNVKGLADKPPLKFTGDLLANIYLGKITKWNDPALTKLNDGVTLPDAPIVVVHRKDSSGTTFIFTDYLSGASETWKNQLGPAKSEVAWPVGEGMARNEGVARHVRETEGAIGYVDLMHTFGGDHPDLQYGAVENADKSAFIHVESENMTAAAKGLKGELPEDLTFKLTNKPGKDAYPICGVVWAVCYQNPAAADERMIVDFLHWVAHEGQQFAKKTSYAPLPDELVERVDQKLQSIKGAQ